MGYNGSNRRGYDVRYQGFKKSSMRVGNRLFDSVTKLGLLAGLAFFSSTPSAGDAFNSLADADFSHVNGTPNSSFSQRGMTILVIILLCFVPVFQWVCYRLFLSGWWPFFSFLFFGTFALICLGLAGMFLDINSKVTPHRWIVLAWTIFGVTILNILLGLWVFWRVPFEEFTFVHGLVLIQDVVSIILLFYIKGSAVYHTSACAETTSRTIVAENYEHKQRGQEISSLDCVITTGSEDPYGRTWYYIHAKENPMLECVVDCIKMTTIKEDYAGRNLIKQIARGEEIGVRISGYAIFVHPSQKTKRESGLTIDNSLLPQIQDLAYNFYRMKIQFAQFKFDDFRAGDGMFD